MALPPATTSFPVPKAIGGFDKIRFWSNGNISFLLGEALHRTDGPAFIGADGSRSWLQYGREHRIDGPAVIGPDGDEEHWIDGRRVTEAARSQTEAACGRVGSGEVAAPAELTIRRLDRLSEDLGALVKCVPGVARIYPSRSAIGLAGSSIAVQEVEGQIVVQAHIGIDAQVPAPVISQRIGRLIGTFCSYSNARSEPIVMITIATVVSAPSSSQPPAQRTQPAIHPVDENAQ